MKINKFQTTILVAENDERQPMGSLSYTELKTENDLELNTILKDIVDDIVVIGDLIVEEDNRLNNVGSDLLRFVTDLFPDKVIICKAAGLYADEYDPLIFYNPILKYEDNDPSIQGKSPAPYNKIIASQIKFLAKNRFVVFCVDDIIQPDPEKYKINFYRDYSIYLNDAGKDIIRKMIVKITELEFDEELQDIRNSSISYLENVIAEKSAINFNS